jgi:Flp pilus assembly protein TadG
MTSRARLSTAERGSALVEFALVSFLLVMMLFATIEFERMLLVSTTLANAATAGLRYAIVHGSSRTGSGVDGRSGPTSCGATPPPEVATVVKNFASTGLLNTSNLNIQVCYVPPLPGALANTPGSTVTVKVKYTYDPLSSWFKQLQVPLGSTAQGVITY